MTTASSTATRETLPLSARLERLKERVLAGPRTPVGFRCLALCEAALAHADRALIERRARGLARLLETFPVEIGEEELLAGTHLFGEKPGVDAGFDFPEFAPHYWTGPREALAEALARSDLSPDQQAIVLSTHGRYHELLGTTRHGPTPPEEVRLATEAGLVFGWGSCVNHSVRDYAKVLRVGFEGIAAEVEAELAACRIENPEDLERSVFLQAAAAVTHAAAGLGRRYAAAARRLAAGCTDPERRAELEQMAAICDRVPAQPARTFAEAVQALWFAHAITCAEDHINANSLGRLDQILGPYYRPSGGAGRQARGVPRGRSGDLPYRGDAATRRLTREQAVELLMHLWLKLYRDYDVQQATVGGLRPDGRDATHPVSHLCLEATERLGLVRCLSVRLHRRTPQALLTRALRLVSKGGGIPFFFNDEAIVPALVDKGIPPEEARDYAIIGCVEITIPGRANPHAVSHNTNLAKCFELALNDGRDPASGRQVGPRSGELTTFRSGDEVLAAYQAQAEHAFRVGVWLSNAGELEQQYSFPLVYQSLLTEDCLRRGQDITAGGARYNYHSCSAIGIPNVADSIAALDQLVFREGRVTLDELQAALAADFQGHESLRQMLLQRGPKYGNDLQEVDGLAAEVARHFCATMATHRTLRGGTFHAHLFSFVWHVDPCGKLTGALPDGRRAAEPLAYSLSATQGRDRQGLTAFLNSLARIPHHLAAASSSAIIEVSPSFFRHGGLRKLGDLVRAAVERGVGQMQFNVVSAERLRQAQEDPERYGNIVVRVSGFSQRFCQISPDLQDHIIERTKHEG